MKIKNDSPRHLQPETRRWYEHVVSEFDLEAHHKRLLSLAAEAWDRGQNARKSLAEAGSLIFIDRFGQPHSRPEVAIERDAAISFARLIRELCLDIELPAETPRPPTLGGK